MYRVRTCPRSPTSNRGPPHDWNAETVPNGTASLRFRCHKSAYGKKHYERTRRGGANKRPERDGQAAQVKVGPRRGDEPDCYANRADAPRVAHADFVVTADVSALSSARVWQAFANGNSQK